MKIHADPQRRMPLAILAAAAILVIDAPVFAVEYEWTGAANNAYWGDANNWSPVGIPNDGENDTAILPKSGFTNILLLDATGIPASFVVTNLVINSTNVSVANVLTIPAGQSLQTTFFLLGPNDLEELATTDFKVKGEGELRITPATQRSDEVVRIGRSASGPGNIATLDLSGLSSFYVTNSGRFVIGDKNGAGMPGTIILASNSTISTTEFDLGFDPAGMETIVLGVGTNRLQGTIRMAVGTAGMGTIKFQDGDTNGVAIFRNRSGTGKMDIQMQQSNSESTMNVTNLIDLRGHYADLNVRLFRQSALNTLGIHTGRKGVIDNRFYFDRGVFNMDSALLGWAGDHTNNVNLFSIGGGSVNVTAVNQFTSVSIGLSGLAPATLHVGGGTLTLLNGGIGKYTLVDTTNVATLILNSTNSADPAVLDMNGNYIGTDLAPLDIVEFAAGTLKNLSQFNGGSNLVKSGFGVLTLSGTNAYTGGTVIESGTLVIDSDDALSDNTPSFTMTGSVLDVSSLSGGTLVMGALMPQNLHGSGTILGGLDVEMGSTLSLGNPTGTLSVTNSVTLGGTTLVSLNREATPNSGRLEAANITFGGELIVTNAGPGLLAGQSFQLFNGPTTGAFVSVSLPATDHNGATYTWTDKLAIDGTIQVLTSSVTGPDPIPTSIAATMAGNSVILAWPESHTGWLLQVQTNSLSMGLSPAWHTIPGSENSNESIQTIDRSQGSVFFRLVYP